MEAEQRAPQVISSRVTAALLACGMFMPVGLFAPSLVLPQLGRSFAGVAHAEMLTELVGALASFAFAVASPAAGAVIARLGCRRVIATALILFAVGGALPALLNNIWLILVARVGVGIALAAVFTGALVGLGSFPGEQRNRMFGWFSVVGGVTAIFLFPVVAAIGQYGWRPAFLVNLSALLVIPLVLQLPEALGTVAAKKSPIDSEGKQSTGRLVGPAMAGHHDGRS